MLFNSFGYAFLFLPFVAITYGIAQRYVGTTSSRIFLLIASCVFYGFQNPSHLPLLFGSVLFNWAIGKALSSTAVCDSRRRLVLWTGISANIFLLFSFKYINLFFQGLAALHGPRVAVPDLAFPLGISFFTLSQVMYLVDVYQSPTIRNSLFDQFTFVCFFPCITAGPICRASDLISQFKTERSSNERLEMACRGIFLFTLGLAKKVAIADAFARIADTGFQDPSGHSTLEAWVFCLCYTFQIYFDFSGYSDMAMGSAMLLGIKIPQNFDAPFRSTSISEYWQRWHMSLSAFITSYLYTPLLRSFGGRATLAKSATATIVAMTIAGIWHGPAWTFAVYGVVHGIALAANQVWKRHKGKMPRALAWLMTFGFVNLSFVLFRSPSLKAAGLYYMNMLPHTNLLGTEHFFGVLALSPITLVKPVAFGVVLAFLFKTSTQLAEEMPILASRAMATGALILLSMFFMNSTAAKTFIYFAF